MSKKRGNKYLHSFLAVGFRTKNKGFALPTVLIASVIMLTVLVATTVNTSSIISQVKNQNYDQLAKDAADAGAKYAKSCLDLNKGVAKWTDAKPLTPYTDCYGEQLPGFDCAELANTNCYLSVNGNVKTTFSVGLGQTPPDSRWLKVSEGLDFACGVNYNNKAYCWGNNVNGQLGTDLAIKNSLVPVPVDTSGVLSGKTITNIAAGWDKACALDSAGKAYCWGNGNLGDGNVSTQKLPVAVTDNGALSGKVLSKIAAGSGKICAISTSGEVFCWGGGMIGNNLSTGSTTPVNITAFGGLVGTTATAIAINRNGATTCAVASGKAYCWGSNVNGNLGNNTASTDSLIPAEVYPTGLLSGKTVTDIAVGDNHTCAVANGASYCWGLQIYGALGNNVSTTQSNIPSQTINTGVLSGKTVTAITAGGDFSCAVASGEAYCWGKFDDGQLGDAGVSVADALVPVKVSTSGFLGNKTVSAISAGALHVCAYSSDNSIGCWGSGSFGQYGDNKTTASNVPVGMVINGTIVKDVNSNGTVYLIRSSDGVSWRQYNQSSRLNVISPVVTSQFKLSKIDVGYGYVCGIGVGNTKSYCWGNNDMKQLGDSLNTMSMVPSQVNTTTGALAGKTLTAITAAGYDFVCAIASDSKAYCWGRDSVGELGRNTVEDRDYGQDAGAVYAAGGLSGKNITSISSGHRHTCVATNDATNNVYCWGYNASGRLGDNTTVTKTVPTQIYVAGEIAGKTVSSVTSGEDFTCALTTIGTVYCWGENSSNNELGIGTGVDSPVPKLVSGLLTGKTVTAISSGSDHTCVITSEASANAYCWGEGLEGEIGDNNTADATTPRQVSFAGALSGKRVTAISAGQSYTCAVAGGGVYCWGDPANGVLGNGDTTTPQPLPVAVNTSGVLNGRTMTSISTSVAASSTETFTCAIDSDGFVYCWGANGYGQLGNNSLTSSSVPVKVYTTVSLSF